MTFFPLGLDGESRRTIFKRIPSAVRAWWVGEELGNLGGSPAIPNARNPSRRFSNK